MSGDHFDYRSALSGALSAVRDVSPVRLDLAEVERLCDAVAALPRQQASLFIRNCAAVKHVDVARSLSQRSFESRHHDSAEMRRLADLAVEVSDSVAMSDSHRGVIKDAQAEARIHRANAERVRGDLRAAASTWDEAEDCLGCGTADPLLAAQFAYFKGVFRMEQGRPTEAAHLLENARRLYTKLRETALATKVRMTLAEVCRRDGDLVSAIRHLYAAARSLPREDSVSSRIAAVHNLVFYLDDAGHSQEAFALLLEARPLYDLCQGQLMVLEMRWLEGRLARSLGEFARSEQCFKSLRDAYATREMDFEAARASLELASVLAQQDRHTEVAELAEEMYPIFISKDIPREATAALVLFSNAVRQEVVSAERIQQLIEKVEGTRGTA